MRKQILAVRSELRKWAAHHTEPQITERCRTIGVNLLKLAADPNDMPLRVQTAKNVADLEVSLISNFQRLQQNQRSDQSSGRRIAATSGEER